MKRPDNLMLIAIWQFINAFIALIGICVIAVFVFPDAIGPLWGQALAGIIFTFSVSILLMLVFISIAIAGGIGLLRGYEWGRVLGIVHAALNLFVFPIGTTIGVLVIIYLTKSDVSQYFKANSDKKK